MHLAEPQGARPHARRSDAAFLILGIGLALILYAHGAAWWYAPLALPGLVLAHLAILGGGLLLARPFRHGRRVAGGGARESTLLHNPRQFDLMSRVITFGREKKLRRWMLDLADLHTGSAVLDVGCGTGTLLLAAAEHVGPSGTLHGIEPSAEMTAHARRKAERRGIPLVVDEASAECLPYPAASFDAVFCTLVFHHLPPAMQHAAIGEIRRVLRPGGTVVIADWQRPKSVARAIASALSLVYLLHNLGPSGPPSDLSAVERSMGELGFENIARRSFGSGVVGAVIGRAGSGAGAAQLVPPREAVHAPSGAGRRSREDLDSSPS